MPIFLQFYIVYSLNSLYLKLIVSVLNHTNHNHLFLQVKLFSSSSYFKFLILRFILGHLKKKNFHSSGSLSFQQILIQCQSSATLIFYIFPVGAKEQFSVESYFKYQVWNRLLSSCLCLFHSERCYMEGIFLIIRWCSSSVLSLTSVSTQNWQITWCGQGLDFQVNSRYKKGIYLRLFCHCSSILGSIKLTQWHSIEKNST